MKILTNKFFILGNLLLILLAIPLTMFFVSKQQQLRSKAAPSSRLYFSPSNYNTSTTCPSFTLDVMLDPGSNSVSFVDFTINYDPSQVSVTDIAPSTTFSTVQRAASISGGTASISLDAVGGDVTKVVTTTSKVATITFAPKAAGTAQITFDSSKSQVLSLSTSDQPYTNVLSSADPTTVTIGSDACTSNGATGTPGVSTTPAVGVTVTPPVIPLTSVTPGASTSASPTPIIPTPTPTLIPTATPTLVPTAIPTAVPTQPPAAPTVAPTGSFAQTVGIIGGVILTLGVGFILLAL